MCGRLSQCQRLPWPLKRTRSLHGQWDRPLPAGPWLVTEYLSPADEGGLPSSTAPSLPSRRAAYQTSLLSSMWPRFAFTCLVPVRSGSDWALSCKSSELCVCPAGTLPHRSACRGHIPVLGGPVGSCLRKYRHASLHHALQMLCFYKLKARPPSANRITTRFAAVVWN